MRLRPRFWWIRPAAIFVLVAGVVLLGDMLRLALSDPMMRRALPPEVRVLLVRVEPMESWNKRLTPGRPWRFRDFEVYDPGSIVFGDFLREGELTSIGRHQDGRLLALTLEGDVLHEMAPGHAAPMAANTNWITYFHRWFPAALVREGRDLVLAMDARSGRLSAIDALTRSTVWEVSVPGAAGSGVGAILPVQDGGRTVAIVVHLLERRRLAFVSPEGGLLAEVDVEPDTIVGTGPLRGATVVVASDASGRVRFLGLDGTVVDSVRLRLLEGLAPLSVLLVEDEDGGTLLRTDFSGIRPLFHRLDGSVPESPEGEVPLTLYGNALWLKHERLPGGGVLSCLLCVQLLDRHGRMVDQLEASEAAFMATGAPAVDGKHLMWMHDQMNYRTYLVWMEVRE
jgi:hypothetical protein